MRPLGGREAGRGRGEVVKGNYLSAGYGVFDPVEGDCRATRPRSPDFAARRVHVVYAVLPEQSSQPC